MFKFFDIYDKGCVDLNDFEKAMNKIGLYYTKQELLPLFKQYDIDKSNTIDYKEFSAIIFGADSIKGQMVKRAPVNS
jgi:Ca2+-binding EF-hand superfamily protein